MPDAPLHKLRDPPPAPTGAARAACAYAELDVTSNFSFLRGASHPDELVFRAAELGYRAIAITDVNTLAGVVRAHDAARQVREQGGEAPKLLIGSRLTFSDGPDLLVWAMDRAGYGRLCRLLTLGKRRAEKGDCWLTTADFLEANEGLLAAVVCSAGPRQANRGDAGTPGPPPAWSTPPCLHAAAVNPHSISLLKDALGDRLSLAVCRLHGNDDESYVNQMRRFSLQIGVPLLATNHVHYHDPSRRALQDVLTCVRHGCTIHDAGFRLFPNGERYLRPPDQMHRLFADCPEAIRRGLEVAERCSFSLDELRYEYPHELVPEGKTPIQHLGDLAWQGAASRYGRPQAGNPRSAIPDRVRDLLIHELRIIEQLRFEPYFLTVHDIVQFARSRGILCQGRGSAANSAVCYCLGITSVDPARIDVLFERFISAARNEPPDIDVDFEHERREEVIQYIYGKYGRERAGMTAEVITYRGRSAVRDVGKALGLSLDLVDQLAGKLDWWHRGTLGEEQLRELGLNTADPTIRLVVELTGQLLGFPRHLSQHVGGMVMTRGPLCELVPIENASMPNRTVIEWDKDDIDALGILKVDVLALGMLTCISKAFALINEYFTTESAKDTEKKSLATDERGFSKMGFQSSASSAQALNSDLCSSVPHLRSNNSPVFSVPSVVNGNYPRLELHTVPPEDPAVYDMICQADTVGVFQIESRAQMSMLPRLRPRCFYDLVIEVAIVRPGPIQGNMVHPYLRRRNGQEAVSYPSEALRHVLEKTLGVPLFQEQAMRVAMVGAGFSAEEADRLRRAMAAWRKHGEIDRFRQKIIGGMLRNGYTRQFAEQCFLQIRGFGEYGFPESHAASFALLVYVSGWLKRHHPAAFCAALLNSQPMGFYAPAQIVRDAAEHGVEVRAVDVNYSAWDCVLEERRQGDKPPRYRRKADWGATGPVVRLGLRLVKGLRQDHAERLTAAREKHGPFASIAQLHRLTGLPRHALRRLAEADAFGSLGLARRQALWQVLSLSDEELPLFDSAAWRLAEAVPACLPKMPLRQEVMTDYRTAGLSLKTHPVALARSTLAEGSIITSAQLQDTPHGRWARVAGLVLIRQRPGTASGIVFITIEDETGIVNLIVRPNIYEKYRRAARQAGLLEAHGYVERQGSVIHVMAWRLYDRSELLAGCDFASRDFH